MRFGPLASCQSRILDWLPAINAWIRLYRTEGPAA